MDRDSQRSRVAAILVIGVAFAGSTLLTPLYPIYQARFGFETVVLTLVYAAYIIGNLIALLFFGRLSDRVGRRRVILPGLAVGLTGAVVFMFAGSAAALALGRALSGFAVGIAAGAGTAWLVDSEGDAARGTLIATTANFGGIAVGPLMAGLLAEYAAAPLLLPHLAYAGLVCATGIAVLASRERQPPADGPLDLRARVGIPAAIRGRFVAPAITAFCTFGFVGLYAALVPGLLGARLGITDHAVAGVLIAGMFVVAAIVNVASARLAKRRAMLTGLALQLPALALLVTADRQASLGWLIAATTATGCAAALGYRGSLGVVNQLAPADRRAETVSSYMMVCFTGNALPVIGVAVLGQALDDPVAALSWLTTAMGGLAIAAIGLELRLGRRV